MDIDGNNALQIKGYRSRHLHVCYTTAKRIADKLDIHYTPKHGSWLNMAEIELSHLSRQCLGGRIAAKATLINKVQTWNTKRNEKHAKAHWQFTTDDARVKLCRLYPIIST